MASDREYGERILTPPFRAIYPSLFQRIWFDQANKVHTLKDGEDPPEGKKAYYSVTGIFPGVIETLKRFPKLGKEKVSLKHLAESLRNCGRELWPPDGEPPKGRIQKGFDDAIQRDMRDDKINDAVGYESYSLIKFATENPVDIIQYPSGDDVIDPREIYSGVWLRAVVTPAAFSKPRAVYTFYLSAVQKLADDDHWTLGESGSKKFGEDDSDFSHDGDQSYEDGDDF